MTQVLISVNIRRSSENVSTRHRRQIHWNAKTTNGFRRKQTFYGFRELSHPKWFLSYNSSTLTYFFTITRRW